MPNNNERFLVVTTIDACGRVLMPPWRPVLDVACWIPTGGERQRILWMTIGHGWCFKAGRDNATINAAPSRVLHFPCVVCDC